jgi:hypothetical protein
VDVRRGEHRLLAQRSNARSGEHLLVAANPRRPALALQRLGADPAFFGVRAEHVAGGVEQILFLLRRQSGQELAIGSDPSEELRGVQQVGAQSVPIAAASISVHQRPSASISVQGVRPASGHRS